MWYNVFRALMGGGFIWLYYYWRDEVVPGNGDIYLPPEQLQACDFSDVGC